MADDGYDGLLQARALEEELDRCAVLLGVKRFQVAGSVDRLQKKCQQLREEADRLLAKLSDAIGGG